MSDNEKKVLPDESNNDEMPDISSTASATECTGLMPTPPENEDELEAYQQLYDMEIPEKDGE